MTEKQSHTDIIATARRWIGEDGAIVLATVADTWGSAPVPVGGQMVVVGSGGRFAGSVSGGCVEGDVIAAAGAVAKSGQPQLLAFGVADETAWRAGLPCGGRIKVFIQRLAGPEGTTLLDKVLEARAKRTALVVKTALDSGATQVFATPLEASGVIADCFASGESRLATLEDGEAFLWAIAPQPRIVIVGATHIAQILAALSELSGYEVIVADPRAAFASDERFKNVTVVGDWPQDALQKLGLDSGTALVALTHVAAIDDEALKLALRSACRYVGVLGSKRNHAKRSERLAAAGFSAEEIGRAKSPVGLDIGARTPPEIAVSILAEIVQSFRGRKYA